MASLKEIKTRISSVDSTKKITSAMKMVASAKLRKAQKNIETFLPYEQKLNEMLNCFLSADKNVKSVYTEQRELNRIAIVAVSSNSSLCGAFNSTVIKKASQLIERYSQLLGKENVEVISVGKKITDAVKKMGFVNAENYDYLVDKPTYDDAVSFAEGLVTLFAEKKVDQIIFVYQHFKSTAVQQIVDETYLPLSLSFSEEKKETIEYILEPNREHILALLLPKVLRLKVYTILLDSIASEQAARTLAMQIATDNAEKLLEELTIQYNKGRQQAITNELLDIMGGQQ